MDMPPKADDEDNREIVPLGLQEPDQDRAPEVK
jgi:hypothetical protein